MPHGNENETARNIRLYRAALPKMRGRVAAVLWMLIISAALLTGTTFAWVTLSTAPEVTGVTTTVTANGALEIALSDTDGLEPDASAVGDSSAAENRSVTAANLTWGNLVNLSDSSYGLNDLTLYPSRINLSSLRTSPLMAVNYGADGRVTTLNSALRYAAWNTEEEKWLTVVGSDSKYGVRAVGTAEIVSTGEADLAELIAAAQSKLAAAEDAYAAVVSSNSGYMSELVALVGDYLDYKLNGGDAHDYASYTPYIYNMYEDLCSVADKLGEAYTAIAEIYQYSLYGATEGVKHYTPYILSALQKKTEAELSEEGITLTGWDVFCAMRENLENNAETMWSTYNSALAGNTVSWDTIKPQLAALFPYDSAKYVYRGDGSSVYYTWTDLQSMWTAAQFVCFSNETEADKTKKTAWVELTAGLLYNFEELISYSMSTDRLEAHFSYKGLGDDLYLIMRVSTTAGDDYASSAIAAAPEDSSTESTATVAKETYGMAIDLWVRTNAEGTSYLTLDGAFVTDEENNVVGYEGSNRIWENYDTEIINGTSTTQGGGSCYVFYYDTAEDLPRILNLLKGMKVVFFDTSTGTKLGAASFDTTNYYENSGGRVTVPLTVDSSDSNEYKQTTTTDGTTEETRIYYITALNQNEATRITALLYLDGTTLTNEQASASSDFTGTLNLQFKSTSSLISAADTTGDLYSEAVELSAAADVTKHVWDDDNDDKTTTVTLKVGGNVSPTNISASYGRQVNSGAQALRQETVQFTQSADDSSVWTMTYTFPSAGTYVLSNVTLDGQEYELDEPITVVVEGISVNSVTWDYGASSYTVFTAESTVAVPIEIDFSASYEGSQAVRAAFVSDSGKYVYATLSGTNGTTWTGSASITSSGTYTLKYFYIGSDVYDIPESLQKTLKTYMGLRVAVRLSSEKFESGETTVIYEDGESYDVNVSVTLTDNSGSVLRNITGSGGLAEGSEMKLRYGKSGSSTEYLETALTWNSDGTYTGQFSANAIGVYSFSALTIGAESVTSSTSAPSLVVRYYVDVLPEYYANNTEATQTVIGGTGSFSVKMTNSSTDWAIKARVKDADDVTDDVYYILDGVMTGTDRYGETWTFAAVNESGDALEGNFRLEELQLYPAGSDVMTSAIDVTNENITAKIVTNVYVTATYNGTTVTDSDVIALTSSYAATSLASVDSDTEESSNFYAVASYDISALEVVLADFEGDGVEGLQVAGLEYTLDTDSTGEYGYEIVYNESAAPLKTETAATTADGKTYTFGDEIGFNLWG